MPQVKPLECIRALERLGFVIRYQTGSHIILRHSISRKITSVPNHPGDLKRWLLMTIIKQSGFSQDEFLNVL